MYILNGRHTLFDTHVCERAHTQQQQVVEEEPESLSKSTDIFQEKGPGKSKRPPIEYDLSKSLPLSDINCT